MGSFLSFPDPVNDYAARTVAAIVVGLCVAILAVGLSGSGDLAGWLLLPLAYGFWARVLSGPKISPAGLFATRLAAPLLERTFGEAPRIPGPPKRFAQGIGTLFSTSALLLWFVAGEHTAALVVIGGLSGAAFLEAAAGFCLGCKAFSLLMKVGIIPESACPQCADISGRLSGAAAEA